MTYEEFEMLFISFGIYDIDFYIGKTKYQLQYNGDIINEKKHLLYFIQK